MSVKDTFQKVYQEKTWQAAGNVSLSGSGSEIENAEVIAKRIQEFIERHGIEVVIDCPCGDYNWQHLFNSEKILYIGYDIVSELIESNKMKHPQIDFHVGDVIESNFGTGDLMIVRDCLVHLSEEHCLEALKNIARQDIKYVAITHFGNRTENVDTVSPNWRTMNLLLPPYNLPAPVEVLLEECKEANGLFSDKSLAVFEVAALRDYFKLQE